MCYRSAIIHISDIECGKNNRADGEGHADGYEDLGRELADDVRRALEDIGTVPADSLGLILSGDTATFGKVDEYTKADRFIETVVGELSIPRERLAIIPGNHDVDWAGCEVAFDRRGLSNKDDEVQRKRVRDAPEKLAEFSRFFERHLSRPFGGPESAIEFPGFADLGVALVGFDTTLPCTFRKADNYGMLRDRPVKQGKTFVDGLVARDQKLLPVSLLHHNPLPIAGQRANKEEVDTSFLCNGPQACQFLTKSGFRFILCGHEHRTAINHDVIEDLHVLMSGSFGLDADGLRNQYRQCTTVEPNKYSLLLIDEDGPPVLEVRCGDHSGGLEQQWHRGGRYPLQPTRRASTHGCMPQFDIARSQPIPEDDQQWTIAVRIEPACGELRDVRKVCYFVDGSLRGTTSRHDSRFAVRLSLEKPDLPVHAELHFKDDTVVKVPAG